MAFNNVYTINVDLKRRLTSVVPTFKQGDSGVLRFRIYDDGVLYNLDGYTNSEITFTLPSGQSLLGNPELENGEIVYNFTRVEMSEIGKIDTVLTIMSGITQVSIQPFSIFIFDSMRNEDLSYIGILQGLISEVQNLGLEIGSLESQLTETLRLSNEELENLRRELPIIEANEASRVSAENLRLSAETERINNEQTRVSNEISRTNDEQIRINNENARIASENQRLLDEQTRQDSEANRVLEFSRITSFDYNMSDTYYKNNVVVYNGSSYIVLQEISGVIPVDDKINYRLLAQRGVDGNGSVSSVNGTFPDVNGNITLELTPAINNLTSTSTTNSLAANQGRLLNEKIENHTLDRTNKRHIEIVESLPTDFTDRGLLLLKSEGGDQDVPDRPSIDELISDVNTINNNINDINTAINHHISNDEPSAHKINNIEGLSTRLNDIGTLSTLETTNKNDLVSAINETFTQAVNGKTVIANAINGKGGSVTSSDTFSQLASAINDISGNNKMASGTVQGLTNSGIFQNFSNNSTSNNRYIEVSGLNFKPSIIIVRGMVSSYYYTSLYTQSSDLEGNDTVTVSASNGATYTGTTSYHFKANANDAYVNETGFKIPTWNGVTPLYSWVAYE